MHEVSTCSQERKWITDRQIRLGQKIMTQYETYRKADSELGEAILRTQHHWLTIEMEMQVLRGILPRLNGKLQIHFSQVFHKLQTKLQEVVSLLDTVIGGSGSFAQFMRTMSLDGLSYKKGKLNRLRFATQVKGDLDKILVDLGDWHGMLQLSWFLLSRVQDSAIDAQLATRFGGGENQQIERLQELRNAIHGKSSYNSRALQFIEEQEWIGSRAPVLYSAGTIARDSRTMALLYIETFIPHPKMPSNISAKNVRDLANILSTVDPMVFCILSCQGVIIKSESPGRIRSFELIFEVPKYLNNPQTFREVLLKGNRYPLDSYFRFARRLARAVMFVHSADFVHKNLRPDTILVFTSEEGCNDIGDLFLVGFESFRPMDGCTYLVGDSDWQKNLYRHPTRQGVMFPEDYYQMQHDIYSLGVCLLELGMGESFVIPDVVDTNFVLSPIFPVSEYLPSGPQKGAKKIKEQLIAMAKLRLPVLMGHRYTQVVVMCLSCLDGENNDFGNQHELFDSDGILVGVRYIEKVCGCLFNAAQESS